MIPLTFTMTACRRPEILWRTLVSFRANLCGVDWEQSRIFINIDPIPGDDSDATADVILSMIDRNFGECHRYCLAIEPNFAAALKWCWTEATTGNQQLATDNSIFHLEDDWELLEPIEIASLIELLDVDSALDPALSCVNLRHRSDFPAEMDKLFLAPGLWRTDAIATLAQRLNQTENPEVQLHAMGGFKSRRFPAEQDRIVLKDLGRDWLAAHGLRRNAPDPCDPAFTHWVKSSA